jgi:hypothetical protein
MNWKSYLNNVQEVFLTSWYDWDDYDHYDPQYAEFLIMEFKPHIMEYNENFGIEQYHQCIDCGYYHSELTNTDEALHSWNKCPKRIREGVVEIDPFAHAEECFVPGFWATSYGEWYYGADSDKYFKLKYKNMLKERGYI